MLYHESAGSYPQSLLQRNPRMKLVKSNSKSMLEFYQGISMFLDGNSI